MQAAALFSGGKDSTYSILAARRMGHSVGCLVTIHPRSEESHLLHSPNIGITSAQADSMRIPQLTAEADSTDPDREVAVIRGVLEKAKHDFGTEAVVHGGILSEFQRDKFQTACQQLGLEIIAPIWKADQSDYMHKLLDERFDFIMTAVAADGLDDSWLGRVITRDDLTVLEELAERHSFNVSFEGGEAETFVVDCPLFSYPLTVKGGSKTWDGYRGMFEIWGVSSGDHA